MLKIEQGARPNKVGLLFIALGLSLAVASFVYLIGFFLWLAITGLIHPTPGMTASAFLPALLAIPTAMVFVSLLAAIPAACVGAIVILLRFRSRAGFVAAGMAASLLSLVAISLPDGIANVFWNMSAMNGGLFTPAICGGAARGYAAWRFLQRNDFFAL